VTDPILPLLAALLAALLGIGTLAAFLPASARQAIGFAAAGITGLGSLLALFALFLGNDPNAIDLPAGPPGVALHLALDPLAAFFLLFVFLAITVGLAVASESPRTDPPPTLAGQAACAAGLGLALLAADPITLAAGLAIAGAALWATGDPGRSRSLLLAVPLVAAALTLSAVAVLGSSDAASFELTRALPPGPRNTAALALAIAGAGVLAGLVPLHAWLVPTHAAAPPRAASLLSGGVMPVGCYLLLRIPVDLADASPPLWWGLPFLLMGAATAVVGGWRGATETQIDTALAALNQRLAGLAATGVGLTLFGKAADLPNLTALALGSVLLLGASQAVCGTLTGLTAGAIRHTAATVRLDCLGGLIHSMPSAAIALATGLFGLSGLPLGIGFAGTWLLFQALLEAPRAGGLAPQILLAGLAAVLALSSATAAAGAVRLFGVAFLGRPRTPRAAVAEDIAPRARPALLMLAGMAGGLGLFPGLVLSWLAAPAIEMLAGTGLGGRAGLLGLASGEQAPGYAALPLAALVALCAGVTLWLLRRGGGQARRSATWQDGFAAPPAWQPFGDPLTQSDGSGFVPVLPALPGWRPRLGPLIVQASPLWAVLSIIAALLALLTVLGVP